MKAGHRKQAVTCAAIALALAFLWQFLVVRYTLSGRWTGLFYTGGNLTQPPSLADEQLFVFPHSNGYDGQFYHYVAHDPLFRKGLARYIDAPRLRYRRILVPALASLLAAGQSHYIDAALIAVNLFFVFAGSYWLSRFALQFGAHPGIGLLFLLVPAVLVGIDRLTTDLALAALCVGFAMYVAEQRFGKLYLILALAPLARETGLLLTAGYSVALVLQQQFKRTFVFASSAAPALVWYGFVHNHTPAYNTHAWLIPLPLGGLISRMIHPINYPLIPAVKWTAMILDEFALAGVLIAILLAFRLVVSTHGESPSWLRTLAIVAALIALSALNLGAPFWGDPYSFSRIFSPLLLLVALPACCSRHWLSLLPIAMTIPRIGLQFAYEFYRIARAMFA